MRPQTLDNICAKEMWLQVPKAVLVGLDRDLLNSERRNQWEDGMEEIPMERISEVARAIKAVEYVEWIEGDETSCSCWCSLRAQT